MNNKGNLKKLSVIALVTIVWTFVVAYLAYIILKNKYPDSIISIWNVWDTPHYIDIALFGYTSSTVGDRHLYIVFFPLYPLIVKIFSFIFRDYLLSALLVSNISYVGSVIYLFKLVRLDYDRDDAFRSVIYISIFPTAYFLHAAYTESLFIMLTLASFYYSRKENWALSGITGMLAAVTRVTGIILLPVLVIEYLYQKKFKFKEVTRNILWLSIIAIGLIFYLLLNYLTFGDPFKFLEIQQKYWSKELDFPINGLLVSWRSIVTSNPKGSIMVGWSEIVFVLLGYLLIAYSFIRIRISYSLYALASFIIITSTGFWLSIPRYTLSIFPIFILLSLLGRRKELNYLITFLSLTLFMLFLSQFIRSDWAF